MKRIYFYYIIGFVIFNINLYASNLAVDNPVYKDNNAIQAPAGSGSDIANLLSSVNKARALIIAKKYYDFAKPNIEPDMVNMYHRIITLAPKFDGVDINPDLCSKNSMKVAAAISYTNTTNYYLAVASAVFSFDPENITASSNLATAIATYYDELISEGNGSSSKAKQFYADAADLYCYATSLADSAGKYSSQAVVPLNSLGNLFLDVKRFEEAYGIFNLSLSVDNENYTARKGLYDYYMAKKQFKKALELAVENAKYLPAFTRAERKIGQLLPGVESNASEENTSGAGLEKQMETLKNIKAVTAADIIENIDPETARKIRTDIEKLQSKMVIKAPNLDYILAIQNFDAMSNSIGKSALLALENQLIGLEKTTAGYQAEVTVKSQIDMLKQLGVKMKTGFDPDKLQDIINDAMKHPEKYENYNPEVDITGVEGIKEKASEYQKKIMTGISKAKRGETEDIYETMAETMPEFKIMKLNPYMFANPNDLLIQRYNILALARKKNVYQAYLGKVNVNAGVTITDIQINYSNKMTPLLIQYQKKIDGLKNKNLDNDHYRVALHRIHVEYYPKFNKTGLPYWNQATQCAAMAYKKIFKYAAQSYNDCMKHVMLISDEEIRNKVEENITGNLMLAIKTAMLNVQNAYGFSPHYNIAACDCNTAEIAALKEKIDRETNEKANEQIKKNMLDKKNFDQGILDENSKYYKEFIAKYEYEINVGFLKSKVNAYKTKTELNIDLAFGGANFSISTNHLRNTTTYDGGINISASVVKDGPGPALKAGIGFTATKGSDGKFYAEDIDIRANVEGSLTLGVINVAGGVEASAMRGTREYANISVTGDKYLDDFKEKEKKFKWLPGIGKEIWSGEYREIMIKEFSR